MNTIGQHLPPSSHVDVLIVGAGISGIGAGWHLTHRSPGRSWQIIESRDEIGGTWDLFRYPGIRSDSDMFTMGFSFRPWTEPRAISSGESIRQYVNDAADEFDLRRHIRFGWTVTAADWDSAPGHWNVTLVGHTGGIHAGETLTVTARFLFMCSGYYRYSQGYLPSFPGIDDYEGVLVHPQRWDAAIDYSGKRVVVIGSGATAMTLVPAMAESAAKVTMLQRSPTYVTSMPSIDQGAVNLRRRFGDRWGFHLSRWRKIIEAMVFFNLCRRQPARVRRMLLGGVRAQLGPDYDIATHFTPDYNPWEQRLCLVPDGDLFAAIRSGRVKVVTDQIEHFDAQGVLLKSGERLDADIVVTATGLVLQLFGGAEISVDGVSVDWGSRYMYRGMMFNGVPNFANAIGYTNASWTLKCDLTCEYVTRVLNRMERDGAAWACPDDPSTEIEPEPMLDFSSGYVRRSIDHLPKQGTRTPWKLYQNYLRDLLALRYGRLRDGVLRFGSGALRTEKPGAITGALQDDTSHCRSVADIAGG
ncbi:MAG: FAD-containing monooxygenase EthA [Gammaproteobacteria bacterium]|nr:FAD-containing monooxygenase EthA [Gammaproteobacteria bacterium]RPG27242.1 MAG: NAD(P)/FAD-dependent oxidoreductase [Gammaproteobacteria bacterium TMED50]|tara:strand:+ start:48377 stop:49960 length:1584 start_codon:yes stop_codon:yes gene_type:complete